MPIRIYDISKKLGLENKEILAKAKAMGIRAAIVPSSSLDKITGEWLVEELLRDHPELRVSKQPAELIKPVVAAHKSAMPADAPIITVKPPIVVRELAEQLKQKPFIIIGDLIKLGVFATVHQAIDENTAQQLCAKYGFRFEAEKQNKIHTAVVSPPDQKIGAVKFQQSPAAHHPTTQHQARILQNGKSKPSQQFESQVRQVIEEIFPFSVLSNILLFHAERAHFASDLQETVRNDYAVELDHLLHRADDGTDNLILVECKNQPIEVRDERTWNVNYRDPQRPELGFQPHNVQQQIERHARAVRAYVNPLARGRQLSIDVIVVSSAAETPYVVRHARPWLTYYLVNLQQFTKALGLMTPPPLRIVQSDLLGLLRLGLPVAELGHPELPNAIAYIERCRRNLDSELFRAFEPTKERWAINGSAGMGKSVLLAYSLFALTTDRRVEAEGNHKQLVNFAEQAAQLNLPPLGQRRVYAFALKEKQRQVIETLFRRFVDDFSPLSKDYDLGIRRPAIQLWTGKIPDDCHVLVLDEAHDLSSAHAKLISDWVNEPGKKRYLLIACDRHQKLRLVGRDENIIEGISFSLKTKKLRLNYRNPFAVYSASLGLMFRWFAKDGPKVLPTKDDLQNGFGFTVEENDTGGSLTLSMRNDAHPANSWSDCVSIFPNCEAALARLHPCRFQPQDVLWVRFDDEDEHFDYEQLSCFTYHNLNSPESVELTDKYVKGQDFPIVVIEGFSEDMFAWNSPEAEQRMWQRRKELYVCSSRATAFLFLIPRVSSGDSAKIREEVQELVRQLSTPHRDKDGFSRTWRFTISPTTNTDRRRMDVFTDAQETAE
jgi:hypothetical protein